MKFSFIVLFFCFISMSDAVARLGSTQAEDLMMIPNGQGVSSPSFWTGLNGGNPSGLIYNSRVKIQAGVAAFDQTVKNLKESGALLFGNGLIGGGVEYSKYHSQPYPAGTAQINWGMAGRFTPIHTVLAVSGHLVSPGTSSYDVGGMIEFHPKFRLGGVFPNISKGLQTVAAGFTCGVSSGLDLVVDAAYQLRYRYGMVKPGMTLHSERVHLSGAYGYRYTGTKDVFFSSKFSGALGLKLADSILLQYQYRVLPEHWLGLTLRMN